MKQTERRCGGTERQAKERKKENKIMTFDTETIEVLRQPLDASLIKHRPGSKGMLLK